MNASIRREILKKCIAINDRNIDVFTTALVKLLYLFKTKFVYLHFKIN